MTNFDVAFDHLLRWEGGYVNNPDDLGGETKYGLTKRRYPDLDIAAPTIEEARAMYRRDFFDGLNLGRLPDRHQYSLFEACVSQGPHGASARYNGERACDRTASSAPITARAAEDLHAVSALANREARYRCIAGFRQNRKFLQGWLNRLESTAEVTYAGFGELVPEEDGRTPSCWRPGRVV